MDQILFISLFLSTKIINVYSLDSRDLREMERKQLLEELYEKRAKNYPDLSGLKTEKKLLERREKVLKMLTTQKKGSDRWKRLSIEREFIRLKLILYFKESPPSIEVILDKASLELLDSCARYETREERLETKKKASLILLKYAMFKKTDEELQTMVSAL